MLAYTNTPSPHHSPATFSPYTSSRAMDPFDAAEPTAGDTVPPPYELSQEDYETKISDALQRSLRIAQSRPSSSASRAPSAYEVWDQDAFEAAQAAGRQSRGAGSEAGAPDVERRRMSNISMGMSAGQKERPIWLGEDGQVIAGRRSAPGGPIGNGRSSADAGYRPSRASAATTSPIEEISRRRLRRYDEEAGIDNPPPPFAAARNDSLGALSGPSSFSGPTSNRPRHSASRSGPPLSPSSSSSSSSSRNGYFSSDAPQSTLAMPSHHSLPPMSSHSRQRRDTFGMHDPSSKSESPRLAFDPAVAYQNNYAYSSTPAAANASAFYRCVA